jgi:hypothetical protein
MIHIFPTVPFLYVSTLWPLVHVVSTTRAVETAAVQRHTSSHTLAVARQRLPRQAAMAFLVLAGLACWVPFFVVGTRGRYPFTYGNKCRPCRCGDEAVLESCAIPARLGVRYIYFEGRGIRGIAPGAFRGWSFPLQGLSLSNNNISALSADTFDGIEKLKFLDLSANNIGTLGSGIFASMPMLRTLSLRSNPLAALRAGALTGLDQLRFLFLDGTGELRVVEPGVLANASRVANVWVGGSALNCSRLRLPGGATCFDDQSCDAEKIGRLGNGVCDGRGGGYDTAACARDGGDCA